MDVSLPTIPAAFVFGIATFFSPCVLPLIPAYISFITGLSIDELTGSEARARVGGAVKRTLAQTLLFILGFSFVFVSLGASATYLGNLLNAQQGLIEIIGGVILIVFGLHIAGVFTIKYLQYEKRIHLGKRPAHILGSFLVGIVFAIGWTPCVGPILASILTLAAAEETLKRGIVLLSAYSLGMAIPFLAAALAIGTFLNLFAKIKKYFRAISIVSGLLLLAVGAVLIIRGVKFFI